MGWSCVVVWVAGLGVASMLDHLNGGGKSAGVDEEAFRQGLESLNAGLEPDELTDLFRYLDARKAGQVSFEAVVRFLSPPSSLMAGVVEKVQARLAELSGQGLLPLPAFEALDQERSGRLTRLQFKEVLVDLGFVLVDDPMVAPSAREPGGRDGEAGLEDELGLHGGEMRQSRDWTWDGSGAKGGRSKTSDLRKKRADFERRIKVGWWCGFGGISCKAYVKGNVHPSVVSPARARFECLPVCCSCVACAGAGGERRQGRVHGPLRGGR
jgi:Ca2+-binding EF-hand superfamily protein